MSERPAMWIHRTWRFWFGIAFLITLTVLMLVLSISRLQISYGPVIKRDGGRDKSYFYEVIFSDSGLSVGRSDAWDVVAVHYASPHTPARWQMSTHRHYGFEWCPEFDLLRKDTWRIFIPAWPFLALSIILWPLWMAWAEKRQLARYRKMSAPADER